jgi:hypothetical protein
MSADKSRENICTYVLCRLLARRRYPCSQRRDVRFCARCVNAPYTSQSTNRHRWAHSEHFSRFGSHCLAIHQSIGYCNPVFRSFRLIRIKQVGVTRVVRNSMPAQRDLDGPRLTSACLNFSDPTRRNPTRPD